VVSRSSGKIILFVPSVLSGASLLISAGGLKVSIESPVNRSPKNKMKAPQSRMKRTETLGNRGATETFLAQRRKGAKVVLWSSFAPLRLCAGIFLCGLMLLACNSTDNAESKTPVISGPPPGTAYPMPPLNGNSLPNMGWELADGTRSVFSDFKGKVLVLDFYATWCLPCRDSVPHLVGLQKKFEDQGLKVVGLNVGGPDDAAEVPSFAKEFGIQYALAKPDEDLASFLLSDSDAIPQTFVFDRQGQLLERLIGYNSELAQRLDRAIESALKTPAP
jgi:cytochrome c biogenesis protein CcmG, thiol:disulfide interchange protein DsbE